MYFYIGSIEDTSTKNKLYEKEQDNTNILGTLHPTYEGHYPTILGPATMLLPYQGHYILSCYTTIYDYYANILGRSYYHVMSLLSSKQGHYITTLRHSTTIFG